MQRLEARVDSTTYVVQELGLVGQKRKWNLMRKLPTGALAKEAWTMLPPEATAEEAADRLLGRGWEVA